jgi:type 2 lantibiotic biosynthesis protein LanM
VHFSSIQAWLRQSPPIDDRAGPLSSSISFAELWEPIARGAAAVLASHLPDCPEVSVLADLRENLARRLSEIGEGAVWEHFNAQRTLSELIRTHLDADERGCPRTLYRRVVEALRADGLETLTAAHPVLRRHLSTTVASWLASSRELLMGVKRDRQMLAETFDIPAGARLIGAKTGVSDPHRGGRCVAILTFATDSADQASVVLKPRDMRIDAAYHRLVSELATATPDFAPLRSLKVLPLDGYGYVEYVAHKLCSNDKELAAFYLNAGRLTAILYVLGCNDCHNENMIAHGDQLILVDAETLLQGALHSAVPDPDETSAREILEARLADSVLRIGLLPHWFFIPGERIARDVSALGIEPSPAENETYTGWSALNTDGMVMGPATRRARLPTSLPVGVGGLNRFGEFKAEYCAGLRRQLEAIAAHRGSWLGEAGLLARFRDLRSRFVRRPTFNYLRMRSQLLTSAALRDEAAQREALIRATALKPSGDVHDDAVLTAERAQLSRLDVPYLEHPIAGRDLLLDDAEGASDFFAESGLSAARRRIESLGGEDIRLQLALVEGAIAAKTRRAHRAQPGNPAENHAVVGAPSAEQRLAAAAAVGDLLIAAAIRDGRGNVEWLGIDSAADIERSCYGQLGPTLYSGASGIALFLAALAPARSDRRADICRELAASACADLVQLLESTGASTEKRTWWRDQPLGLAGSGGQLLAALLLRSLIPEMRRAVDGGLAALLDALDPEIIRADNDLDIIFGCSGLIGPLLRIGTPKAMKLARAAGDRLVERQDGEGGWIARWGGARALTGFSHGASGAAAALARLATARGGRSYNEAAVRALAYERAQYDARQKNWPDYRASPASAEPRFMLSWCHGAPGVALARLCLKSTPLWDEEAAEDLELALAATADAGPIEDSLCCGRLGRAAILRAAHDRGGAAQWRESAGRLEAQALTQIGADRGYRFGDVLGLFQGAAGIGLELLDGLPQCASALAPQVLSAGLID